MGFIKHRRRGVTIKVMLAWGVQSDYANPDTTAGNMQSILWPRGKSLN